MIGASITRSKMSGQPIYLNLRPTTFARAVQNFKAFSDEGRVSETSPLPENFEPFVSDATINECLGWAEFERQSIIKALGPIRKSLGHDLPESGKIFGIAYQFVPEGSLEVESILSQADFFHTIGFSISDFRVDNWRGKGTLVDFSDIISPLERGAWRNGLWGEPYHAQFPLEVQRRLDEEKEFRSRQDAL